MSRYWGIVWWNNFFFLFIEQNIYLSANRTYICWREGGRLSKAKSQFDNDAISRNQTSHIQQMKDMGKLTSQILKQFYRFLLLTSKFNLYTLLSQVNFRFLTQMILSWTPGPKVCKSFEREKSKRMSWVEFFMTGFSVEVLGNKLGALKVKYSDYNFQ